MQITNEIFRVGGSGLTSYQDAAVYLIKFGEHAALVDAGCGDDTDRLLNNILACGVLPEQIDYLLITHCHYDHTGGAKALRERIPCRIVCHEADAVFLEHGDSVVTAATWYGSRMSAFAVDRKISGSGEQIKLGGRIIEAIHIPGHSPGSLAYLTESEGMKVLFGQDVHGPLDASLLSHREDYLESLGKLISLEADILCEGHYGVFKGKDKVKQFIASFLKAG